MNRIDKLFKNKSKNILSIYYPAGYPELNHTQKILEQLQFYGVDMVEIGIPFSDPLADGPVIQKATREALNNGMNLSLLFDQLKEVRNTITMPVLLMGYWNTVYRFGVELFLQRCCEVGVDGVILPDLPLEEYEKHYKELFEIYDIHNIFLVSPQTSQERLRRIEQLAHGFVYVVSSSSTTGTKLASEAGQGDYYQRVNKLSIPSLIGFGIHNGESFRSACKYFRGAIIGTAFIGALENDRVEGFFQELLDK